MLRFVMTPKLGEILVALAKITIAGLTVKQRCVIWTRRLLDRTFEVGVGSSGLINLMILVDDERSCEIGAKTSKVVLDDV